MDTSVQKKKQLMIFSIITFGLPVVMGLFMWYGYSHGKNISEFSLIHMFYPATGAMVVLTLGENKNQLLPKILFKGFIVLTGLMVGSGILSVFSASKFFVQLAQPLLIIGSLLFWLGLFWLNEDQRSAYNLNFKNQRKVLIMILLFIFLYFARIISVLMINGTLSSLMEILANPKTWVSILFLFINLFLSIAAYFGEEYGWRYFLQPILQKRYGSIIGVLIVGVVWGLWHMPLNFFFYTTPEYGIMSVVSQVLSCISLGIFFAYAYMKTDNIWTVVLLHFFNNNFAMVLSGDSTASTGMDWGDVALSAMVTALLFAWPILTTFFKNRKNLNPTPAERIRANVK